jgi:hypothetical protein
VSTDFDLTPATPAGAEPAAPASTLTFPTQPAAPATRTVPVPPPADEPAGSLTAFLVTGGPAVAVIAGCWLLWAYGPWILLGALLLAAVAAIAAIKAVVGRARRARSSARSGAGTPPRGSPRNLLGLRRGTPNSPAGVRKNSNSPGAGGASPGAGRTGGGKGSTVKAAGDRAARRTSMLSRTNQPAGGGGAGAKKTATVRKSAPVGSNIARAAKTLTAHKPKTPAGATPRKPPAPARSAAAHARPGFLARALGKTMPKGRTPARGAAGSGTAVRKNTGKAPAAGSTKPAARPVPARKAPTGSTGARGGKSAAASRAKTARRITGTGKTASGRPKIRITPGTKPAGAARIAAAKAAAVKARKAAAAGRTPGGPVRSKAAAKIARSARRAATHRKVRSVRAKTLRSARRGARATSAIVSPIAARAFMRTGRALGWAQRRMLAIANSTSGPAWSPRLARGIAAGLGGVMAAGWWVSRRRTTQAWLLRHYATTGLGNPAAVAARTAKTILGPARTPAGHTAKPGPTVRITAPRTPTLTLPGATVGTTPDEIADAFDQFLTNFEPESVSELTAHFASFAPMLERFADATTKHAQRLGDEYGVKGGVVDMLDQFGSAFGGMHDLAEEVTQSWHGEHAEDIERTENPRPHEAEVWNYKPGE